MKRFCMRASISTGMRRSASSSQKCSGVTATQFSPSAASAISIAVSARRADDAVEFEIILEQGVVKGHAAPNDRRIGVVAEDDAETSLAQFHGDRRGDLVGSKDDGERRRGAREKGCKTGRAHVPPPLSPFLKSWREFARSDRTNPTKHKSGQK